MAWHEGQLVLNVQSLGEGLRERFNDYEERLKVDAAARDMFLTRRRGAREHHVSAAEAAVWSSLMPS
jgi:hypothetical protein